MWPRGWLQWSTSAQAARRPTWKTLPRTRSTALTHEALACAGRAATPPPVKMREKVKKPAIFPQGAPPPGPPGQDPFMDVPPRRGRRGCRPPVSEAYSLGAAALRKQGSTGRSTFLAPIRPLGVFLSRARARSKRHTMDTHTYIISVSVRPPQLRPLARASPTKSPRHRRTRRRAALCQPPRRRARSRC